MCVIIYKKAGCKFPTNDELKNCHSSNPHGAGFLFAKDGKVHIRKGYVNDTALRDGLLECAVEHGDMVQYDMLLHFRYATHGLRGPEQTHPFPISTKVEDLEALNITCDMGMVHNGILTFPDRHDTLSDTQMFIKDFIGEYTWEDMLKCDKLLTRAFMGDRVVVMNGTGKITYWGNFVEHDECFYSNRSWEKSVSYRTLTRTTVPQLTWDQDKKVFVGRDEINQTSHAYCKQHGGKGDRKADVARRQEVIAKAAKDRKEKVKAARQAYKKRQPTYWEKFVPWEYICSIIGSSGIHLFTSTIDCESCGCATDVYMYRKVTGDNVKTDNVALCPMCAAGWDANKRNVTLDQLDQDPLEIAHHVGDTQWEMPFEDNPTELPFEEDCTESVEEVEACDYNRCSCCDRFFKDLKMFEGAPMCDNCEDMFTRARERYART